MPYPATSPAQPSPALTGPFQTATIMAAAAPRDCLHLQALLGVQPSPAPRLLQTAHAAPLTGPPSPRSSGTPRNPTPPGQRQALPSPARAVSTSTHHSLPTSIFMSSSGSSWGTPLGKRRSTSCRLRAHRSRASCGGRGGGGGAHGESEPRCRGVEGGPAHTVSLEPRRQRRDEWHRVWTRTFCDPFLCVCVCVQPATCLGAQVLGDVDAQRAESCQLAQRHRDYRRAAFGAGRHRHRPPAGNGGKKGPRMILK